MVTSIKLKLSNGSRKKTIAFRYSPNSRYYVALTFEASGEHVCQRIGWVSDYFILQAPPLESAFNASTGHSSIVLGESDDEDSSGNPSHQPVG